MHEQIHVKVRWKQNPVDQLFALFKSFTLGTEN